MPIDANIPLSVQAPQINILKPFQEVNQMQLQGEQLHAMQMENQQRQLQMQDDQRMRQALTLGNGDPDATVAHALRLGVGPKTLQPYQAFVLDTLTKKAKLKGDEFDNQSKNNDLLHGLFTPVFQEQDPAKQQQLYQAAVVKAAQSKLITPAEAAQPYPGLEGMKRYEISLNTEKWVTAQAAAERAKAASTQAQTAQQRLKAEQSGIEAKGLLANIDVAARTVPDNDADWQTWRAALPASLQARLPVMYSPSAADFARQMAITPAEQAELKQKQMEFNVRRPGIESDNIIKKQEAEGTKPIQPAQAATLKQGSQRIGIEAQREQREQATYQNTYGENSNESLRGVEARLRVPATGAAQTANNEYIKAMRAADEMESFTQLARSGNKAAFANMPVAGVLEITTTNGTTRINRNELEAYAGAGSLFDKLSGKLGKLTSGASISPSLLNDIETLHKSVRAGAQRAYETRLDSVNQTYHSNFKPVKAAGAPAAPAKAFPLDKVHAYATDHGISDDAAKKAITDAGYTVQ